MTVCFSGQGDPAVDIRKLEQILLISFTALVIPPILYLCRALDDNTFTSWRWVFSQTRILQVFFFLLLALPAAYALSRPRLSGRAASGLLFLLSFAAIAPLWQQPESILDAARYFVQAKALHEHGIRYFLTQWGTGLPAWTDMPLVPFLYGLVFVGFGEARLPIQVFNTTLFALTAVLTSLIGKKLWDEETGLHAGLLLLGVPYLQTQVPLLLVDVPTMFFLTLAVYGFMQAVEKGGLPRAAGASLAICLAGFSKYSTGLMLSVLPAIALVLSGRDPKKMSRVIVPVLLLTALLAGTAVLFRYDLVRDQIRLLGTYQWAGLRRWQESFVSTFLYQTHPFVSILALCGMYRAAVKRDLRFLVPAWFVLLVLLLQIKRIRYIIPMLPLFALMASCGLQLLADQRVRRYLTLCIAASSLIVVYRAYLPALNSTGMVNLKNAGLYLNTLACDPVEVYALPQGSSSGSTFTAIPILDYYTGKELISPQKWPGHQQESATQTSSLRFTWETGKPDAYARRAAEKTCAIVIISGDVPVPADTGVTGRDSGSLEMLKQFVVPSAAFKYQTFVSIFKEK